MTVIGGILKRFMRKKIVDRNVTATELHRVLSMLDLTLLGIGSTLGIGVYVLAGSVAKDSAGPAVVLSFLVAAVASVLAGLCYAEFGSRVPKAGSAYVYSYVCVGELIAFVVGWNLIMEYVIGVASVAKGYSGYVDQLFGHKMSHFFTSYTPLHVGFLAEYFDAFAFTITFILTLLLAFGVKESSFFNNIFTTLNLIVVLFVVIGGSLYASPKNWMLTKGEIFNSTRALNLSEEKIGEGGFAPFGFHGIMKGAATCFYGFVGFDCIATTGEEAKNPQKSIPVAIILSLFFIFLAYFGISTVVTMMVPYYLQDAEAPLPMAFENVGFTTGKWVVTFGALFGLSTSLLGSMFPMPRVIYSMAKDGVLFKFLSKVHPRFQTPVIATILAGTFGGVMAAVFNLEALIDMMSIGTLTAYTLVAICVLCLRYRKDVNGADDDYDQSSLVQQFTLRSFMKQSYNGHNYKLPTELSSTYTDWAVLLYCFLTASFCGTAIYTEDLLMETNPFALGAISIIGFLMIIVLVSLSMQPVSQVKLAFRVPYVPIVPGLSVLANVYLIMKLSAMTWIRFSVWMFLGLLIYATCLLNGTADKAYNSSQENSMGRKFSRISATGIDSKGFQCKVSDDNPASDKCSMTTIRNISNGNHDTTIKCEHETIEKSIEFSDENVSEDKL